MATSILGMSLLAALFLLGCSAPGEGPQQTPVQREFMFQIIGFKTRNQGGQVVNMFFYYRYQSGLPEDQLPNYIKLRDDVIDYLDTVDVKGNPYWETLNAELCSCLKNGFPVEAISCQLQVKGDLGAGVKYEPGYHSSIETIGDIQPLQIPGPFGAPR